MTGTADFLAIVARAQMRSESGDWAQILVGMKKLVRHLDDGHAYVMPGQGTDLRNEDAAMDAILAIRQNLPGR
jgi:hypothetical protein